MVLRATASAEEILGTPQLFELTKTIRAAISALESITEANGATISCSSDSPGLGLTGAHQEPARPFLGTTGTGFPSNLEAAHDIKAV